MESPWKKWPQWEAVAKIGHGAYGIVYKAKLKDSDNTFSAIKHISVPSSEAEVYAIQSEGYSALQTREYFKRVTDAYVNESMLMKELNGGDNIVSVEDSYVEEKENSVGYDIFIRMELLTPLTSIVGKNAITEEQAIKIGKDICSALEVCEKNNIIHRDIKPDNILCDANGNYKLGDFGIARSLERLSGSLTRIGSENYVAPEVVFGKKYDKRVDTYSLGLVLYALLNERRLPFWPIEKEIIGATERHIAFSRRTSGEKIPQPKNCNTKLAKIILKACAFNVDDRYSSASEMKRDLEKLDAVPVVKNKNGIFKYALASLLVLMLLLGCAFGIHKLISDPKSEDKDGQDLAMMNTVVVPANPTEPTQPEPTQPEPTQPEPTEPEPTEPEPTEPEPTQPEPTQPEPTEPEPTQPEPTQPEPTEPEPTEPEPTEPEPTQPEPTQPESTQPEPTQPEPTQPEPTEPEPTEPEPTQPEPTEPEPTEPEPTIHTHNWGMGVITKNATCKEEGVLTYTCSCEATKTETIAKLTEHQYNSGVTNGNVKTYTCTVCGDTKTETVSIPAADTSKYTYSVSDGEATITAVSTSISGDVVIPSTLGGYPVTSIGSSAFKNCSLLTSVTIPKGVTSIGSSAFYYCSGLKSVNLPDGLITIGNNSFQGCQRLVEITIPDSVTGVGTYAFQNCTNLKSVTFSKGVAGIRDYAFDSCINLTDINIPEGITSIGNGAFRYCRSLTSIELPDTLTGINASAFRECTSLTSIYIPDSVVRVDEYAFYGCNNLTIHAEARALPYWWDTEWNVSNCPVVWGYGADSIDPSQPYTYKISSGAVTITYVDPSTTGELVIPSTIEGYPVTSIGNAAFKDCTGLTSVTIPDSVTNIGYSAFENCTGLTSVYIPDAYRIEYGAFSGCSNLTIYTTAPASGTYWHTNWKPSDCKVVWGYKGSLDGTQPDDSQYYTYTVSNGEATITEADRLLSGDVVIPSTLGGYPVTKIGNSAFAYSNLTSVTIPNSVISIGGHAFSGSSLTSITIPDSVKSIGDHAFFYCSDLTNITIPNGVTVIDGYTFEGCSNLKSVSIPDSVTSIGEAAFYGCSSLTEINIPDGVTYIGTSAFSSCYGLKNISIPDSVTSIGDSAFYYCSDLTSVTIGNRVKTIGSSAFYGCSGLTSVIIPDSVTSIGNYAFSNCGLTDVTIPDSVTSIGQDVFNGCSNLASVQIGSGITVIPQYTFANCTSLISITLHDGITAIGGSAFEGCESLQELNIGSNVTTIGSYAFWGCVSLKQITVPQNVTVIKEYAFDDCYDLIIYAEATAKPDGWEELWDDDEGTVVWGYGAEEPVVPPTPAESDPLMYSYRVSGESAIITATSPTLSGNVTIPSTLDGYPVKGIEKEAFNNRTGITYVTMPDSINYIGEYAFSACKGLKGVTIGNNLFSIYNNAFRGCSSLESINIPEKVTYIGTQAFYDCTSLKEVSITNLDAWFGIEFGSKDSNPLFYGGGLYLNGELVTCVEVGDGITAVKDYAFAGSSLSEVVIGDSVKTIGFDAFAHCKNLRSITIGENVITIYPSSLYECSGLSSIEVAPENIFYMSVDNVLFTKDGKVLVAYAASKADDTYVIPSGTEAIGYWAFGYCTSLKKLVIPRSVLSVDESAIWKCSGLTIYCEASQQPDSWYKNWNRENYPVVWGYKAA